MTPLFAASSKGPSARIPAATAKSSLNPGLRLAASRAWRGMPRASGGALADSVNLAVADSVNLATVRLSVCRAGPLEIPPGSGWRRSRRKGTTRPPRTFQGTAGAAAGVICRCWTQGPSCQRTTRRCGPGVRTITRIGPALQLGSLHPLTDAGRRELRSGDGTFARRTGRFWAQSSNVAKLPSSACFRDAPEQPCPLRRGPVTREVLLGRLRHEALPVPARWPRGRARAGCRPRPGPCRRPARWALVVRSARRSRGRCWRRAVLAGSQA